MIDMVEAVNTYEQHLWEVGVVEPDGTHSEFSQQPPMHGQKIEFDVVQEGTQIFDETIDICAETIDRFDPGSLRPDAMVTVANGANRFGKPIVEKLGRGMLHFPTKKTADGLIVCASEEEERLKSSRPKRIKVFDDTGTTGGGALRAVDEILEVLDGERPIIEVMFIWQRQPKLQRLRNRDINYRAVIFHPLPTYTEAQCLILPRGFCNQGWDLNKYEG